MTVVLTEALMSWMRERYGLASGDLLHADSPNFSTT